ncbi:MAG: DNA repair protein RecO [Candidatus Omnitrophica bacterium]|nr:DNA repair protein RecO [Candidatus Omnitrophota bacterium]
MINKDSGFVLKRHNFRETSLLVTVYTKDYGKIKGILKGFYTKKKEFSSSLDILSQNEFVFYPKRSEIWLISGVDLIEYYGFIRNNISKARVAAVFQEIIDRTMQLWDRNQYIFKLTEDCLKLMAEEDELKVLYIFLIKFLTFSGFKPEFNHCIKCNGLLRQESLFSVSKGGFVCGGCQRTLKDVRRVSSEVTRSLYYIQEADFPIVQRLGISYKCEEEIFYILREFIAYHLEFDLLAKYDLHRKSRIFIRQEICPKS